MSVGFYKIVGVDLALAVVEEVVEAELAVGDLGFYHI